MAEQAEARRRAEEKRKAEAARKARQERQAAKEREERQQRQAEEEREQREAAQRQQKAREQEQAEGRRQAEHAAPEKQASNPSAEAREPEGGFHGLTKGLPYPVRGDVQGRFGTTRPDGGIWRGVVLRAPAGTPVHAIAAGRVVYANWLSGFGNIIIVDHGEGYLSIYAYNQSIDRKSTRLNSSN